MKDLTQEFRVGRRTGGDGRWQVKQGPGWKVVHQCADLRAAACWLDDQGVDIGGVSVLTPPPWLTLAEHVAAGSVA